ncbi:S-adenosyl-L-methionine-dependent methyltransferase [Saccharata proteae CBS 121410]|uniref:S-adenosyl-L-methionine-dependent methyltransferase n=1 Tax=Saccharata proteae CBS 121410 TaxID=1314787 RepID=A0A9P4LUE8_9PEZI|nr:S-adenosyl-L-methionine-dependent methyltransferase [Saccharata proteae CBS 121410]
MSAEESVAPLAGEGSVLEVDEALEGKDSAYGDDEQSFTTSLTSSITDYKFHHGRRFHAYKEGTYQFPNDEAEQDRLDMFHEICNLLTGGKLAFAPFNTTGTILDTGTGTGIWSVEAGERWPAAQILGNDLSPIQPRWVPPNVKFEVDDLESDWTFEKPFDFIHSRYLVCSLSDWPRYIRQCFEFTKEAGWAEFQDWDLNPLTDDGTLTEDNQVAVLQKHMIEACDKMGRPGRPGPKLKEWCETAGYKNVTERVIKLPIGMWPKDKVLKQVGALMMVNYLEALEAMTVGLFTTVLGWSIDEVQTFLVGVRKDMRRKDVHVYFNLHFVYGQKLNG